MKYKVRISIVLLMLALCVGWTNVAFADAYSSKISSIYAQLYAQRGSSYSGWCGQFVLDQLNANGIGFVRNGSSNGNQIFYTMVDGATTSGGYKQVKYSGNNALYDIISTYGSPVENIVVSLTHQYGYTDSNPGYGHTNFIYAIADGYVYFCESFNGYGYSEGQPQVISLSDYMWRYNHYYGNIIGAVVYTKNDSPSASTLQFTNVTYPKTLKIDTTYGWSLGGGTLQSNYTLTKIQSQILNNSGGIVSNSGEKTISGYNYSVKTLDDYSGNDNGVRFSYISTAGDYTWRLTAKDSGGRTLVMDMPFTAISGGSTSTATMSKEYSSTVSVTGVTVDLNSVSLWENETTTLTATVSPSNATNQAVTWTSSNTAIATVIPVSGNSRQATIKAVKAGTAAITCKTADGSKTATCAVTVKKHATGIDLSPTTLKIKVGETSALTATVLPSDATNKTVHWTPDNTSIATVNNGAVKGIAAGTTTITAMAEDGGYTKTCTVTVVVPVSSITLSKSSLSLIKGDTAALTTSVYPSYASNKDVNWTSSNTSVATVDSSGMVTAVGGGTATITCTAADGYGAKSTCNVTVSVPVTKITLSPKTMTLRKGESTKLTADIEPSDATNKTVTWTTSDSNVATVSGGTVTAVGAGTATITCTAADGSGKSDTSNVTVIVPVESVTLNETTLIMYKGDVSNLTATVLPADATNKTVSWTTSDGSVATVNNGRVTAVNPGTAVITCKSTDGTNRTAICNVVVGESNYLLLNETECTIIQNEVLDLYAELHLEDGGFATLVWTCDDGVELKYIGGRQSGHVTVQSLNVGEYQVTCSTSDGTLSSTCHLSIVPAPIESITVNRSGLELDVGQSEQLSADISPDYAAVSGVNWESSDSNVATVTAEGLVKAVHAGSAVITCYSVQDPSVRGECTVVVSNPVTSVILSQTRIEYDEANSQSATLTAEVEPFDATDKTLIWTSSNTSVATVSNGEVHIVGYGYARITCTAKSGVSARCDVIVHADNIMNLPIALKQIDEEAFADTPIQEIILPAGMTSIGSQAFANCNMLRLIYIPESVTSIASNAFSGSNVAFICDKACAATQFAESHGIDYVIGNMPERIIIVLDSNETVKNVPLTLRAIVLPDNTIKRVKWSVVEGSEIASIVNGNELVAASAGQVTVMATAANGVSSTAAVSVLDRYPTYTINLNVNGNGATCDTDSIVATLGKPIGTLPTPTRTGYRFTGWYTGAIGGIYVTGNSVFSDDEMESLDLYAHWTRIPVTITFEPNGGECEQQYAELNSGDAIGTLPEPTRTDYTFDGWFTEDGTEVTEETTFTASATLYAHWTINTCVITFDANGGSCATSSLTINRGSTIASLPTATRTYYTLNGWYTAASDGDKVTNSTVFTQNTTLYAQWTRNTITITYNANGGSVSPGSKTMNQGDAIGTLPTPTRTYYTFNGWYNAATGGTEMTTSTVFTSNTTLYAQWTENAWSDWVEASALPSGDILTESKTQYRYQDASYSDWSGWSGWTIDRQSTSELKKEESATVYYWYHYVCPYCGAHMHVYNKCYTWAGGCGNTIGSSNYEVAWLTTAPSSGTQDWEGTGRIMTGSGTRDRWFYWVDSGMGYPNGRSETGYRYATRSKSWGAWSGWSDTAVSSSGTRNVETRTVYRYKVK